MVLLKFTLLAITAILFAYGIAPPRPRVSEATHKVYKGQPFEYVVRSLAYIACFDIVAASYSQVVLLLTYDQNSAAAPWLCPANPNALQPLLDMSPRFIIGAVLAILGGIIRLWSFHTLGALFTYELVITADHKLITTGPYAYARHPSYTGVLLLLLGGQLMHFGPSGYVPHCGIADTPFLVFLYVWRYGSVFTTFSLLRRCGVEDAQLAERFGETWKEYASKVRYKMIPYVF